MADLEAFRDECRAALDPSSVITDAEVIAGQVVDWTGRWQGRTPVLVRPGSTADVALVVGAARRHGVALVPQGGNTGLVGGSVPLAGEVLVDLRRLDHLESVDVTAAQVTAGAGAVLARLQAHVAAAGLAFGVDHGARDSATIGGMVATNAGGLHVLRHGAMRRQVVGVEAVLGTGEVLSANMTGLVKDNTGYDLPGLLCGSEGTLAIVTQVRLALVRRPPARLVALLALPSVAAAVDALPALRALPSLNAVELVLGSGLELVAHHLVVGVPFAPVPPCALLVELAGAGSLADELAPAFDRLGDTVIASAVADDDSGMARLWRWREAHNEAAAGLGIVHKADVTLPLTTMADFVDQVATRVDAVSPGATTLVYGHLGDGNVHVNVVGPDVDDEAPIDLVMRMVLDRGGSISAEHGIGTAKRRWLEAQRGSTAVAAMRAVKQAFDPDGVLNPNVLFL
ncbi:MAG: FAD-binding oxidoreductase [Acidimicrobiales bacterium]